MAAARQERTKTVESALAATLAIILDTVPLSDQARECITEVMAGGDGNGS